MLQIDIRYIQRIRRNMKVAIVGSRSLTIDDMESYLPENVTEIISGGAKGIDECAKKFAIEKGIRLTEYLPEYRKYGKSAPLKRNMDIINVADIVIAFWDGSSKGTEYVIKKCYGLDKSIKIYIISPY